MEHTLKTAAAIAGVLQYIKTEEETIAMQSARQAQVGGAVMSQVSRAPAPVTKSWTLNGRQAQMQMRNLMQLRTFCKL
jgi:hypothetical protein